jgi:hypothetical protein
MDDFTYFPDLSYLTFSDKDCKVMALAGEDTSLAVITDSGGYIVSGVAQAAGDEYSPEALFTVSRVFSAERPAKNQEPVVFEGEIVYLSEHGVCAVSPSENIDREYSAQIRSEYINEWLMREDLSECSLTPVGDYLVINTGTPGRAYVLDGKQISRSSERPFSYRQYESYYFAGCENRFAWRHGNELFLLLNKKLGRLSFTSTVNGDYIDEWNNGLTAVSAFWETPNIYGTEYYNRKSFAKLGLLLRRVVNENDGREINTAVRVWYKRNNEPWKLLKNYNGDLCVFRYDYINFGLFTYRPTGKLYTIFKKIKLKKTYSLKLRFENDVAGMPLFLQAYGLEYSK